MKKIIMDACTILLCPVENSAIWTHAHTLRSYNNAGVSPDPFVFFTRECSCDDLTILSGEFHYLSSKILMMDIFLTEANDESLRYLLSGFYSFRK